MISRGLSNGVPDEVLLLAVLADNMSMRAAAVVIAPVVGKDAPLVYHDVMVAISPDSSNKAEPDRLDRVRQLLIPHTATSAPPKTN